MKRKSLPKAGWAPPRGQGVWPGCFPEKNRYPCPWGAAGDAVFPSRCPRGRLLAGLLWLAHLEKGESPQAGQSTALAAEREINYGHFGALQG